MSEHDEEHTQILLPSASVTLFAQDSDSMETFMSLSDDWRYARVTLSVSEGGMDAAISKFKKEGSPDLFILETDSIDDDFTDKLEDLAQHCSENTAAIVVGPVNDVNLYRKLIGMGVSDYLVRPLSKEVLADDIASTLIEKIGAKGSRLIAVIGSKGGVGTTALSQALAWGSADILGQKTFIMDVAAGWSSLNVGLDFEPATTLAEAVRAASTGAEDSLGRMLHHASEKLHVLSSGGDVMLDDTVDVDNLETLLDYLLAIYPVVIVDLSASNSILKNKVLARSNEIVIVTTPTLPSLRATRTLIQEIKDLRGGSDNETDLIVNMQGLAPKHEVSPSEIEKALERKASAVVSFNPGLFIGTESEGQKILDDKQGAEIVEMLMPLIRKVVSGEVASGSGHSANDDDKKGGIGSILSKLKSKS